VPEPTVRLLFDQNLSHRLVRALDGVLPGAAHVRELGLAAATDTEVWQAAAAGHWTLVSKDADFHQMSFLLGSPP
jgi:predicted nuclease of predicted toxin-antitoxin system